MLLLVGLQPQKCSEVSVSSNACLYQYLSTSGGQPVQPSGSGKQAFFHCCSGLVSGEDLITCVGDNVETFVVLIMQFAFSQLWCAEEIYTAVQKWVPQMALRFLEFARPTPDANGKVETHMIRYFGRDGKALVQLGITKAILCVAGALLTLY